MFWLPLGSREHFVVQSCAAAFAVRGPSRVEGVREQLFPGNVMSRPGTRFRKRLSHEPVFSREDSRDIRLISDAVSRGAVPAALGVVERRLTMTGVDEEAQSRLLLFVADGQFRMGRYEQAADIYQRAAAGVGRHARHWLRPYVGRVRCLLRRGMVTEADAVTRQAVQSAESRQLEFDQLLEQADGLLRSAGTLSIPAEPLHPADVLRRMIRLFLAEGEVAVAEAWLGLARSRYGRMGVLLRIDMARTTLIRGDAESALRWSREALETGGFRAKTLAAWPVLIAARRKLGGWMIDQALLRGLSGVAPSVRARAVRLLVSELRKHDMRQWQSIALDWLAREGLQYPSVAAELKKMILSSWKALPGYAQEKHLAAQRLMQTERLSRNEWICAAKEIVRTGWWLGRPVDIDQLLLGADSYGPAFVFQARHSLALSCMEAKQHDRARELLGINLESGACPRRTYAKSLWALARMEGVLERYVESAALYRRFWEEGTSADPFCLQAQLLWVDAMTRAGRPEALLDARVAISAALERVTDPELLMNTARRMAVITPAFRSWAHEVFDRAAGMMREAFRHEHHPALALELLFKLTRRQVLDFDRHSDALALWEGLDENRRTMLWCDKHIYWEYLGLLVTAYGRSGRLREMETAARAWMEDPATTPEGRTHIGTACARVLLVQGRVPDALALFDAITLETPSHPLAAHAWYWMALEAHRQGDATYRDTCLNNLRRAQGVAVGLLDEWNLDAKSVVLRADLQIAHIDREAVRFPADFLDRMRAEIERELRLLP